MKEAFVAIALLVVLFTFNVLGFFHGWYIQYWWFDVFLHFAGGFAVALLIYGYTKIKFPPLFKNILFASLFIIASTTLVGVLWEFAEYISGQLVRQYIPYRLCQTTLCLIGYLQDTLQDLALDLAGSLPVAIWIVKKRNAVINRES